MTWLHLSDLHLDGASVDIEIFEYINLLLEEKKIPNINFVFLTGDLSDKDPKSSEIISKTILDNISEHLHIKTDNIFNVSGNHDIGSMEIARESDALRIVNSLNGNENYPELSDYFQSCDKIRGKREHPNKLYYTDKREDENFVYYIVHINSIWLTKMINPDITHGTSTTYYLVLELIRKELEKCRDISGKRSLIFLLNHFPVRFLNRIDLDMFESLCNDFNVDFILTGHTHTASYNTFGENKFIEINCRSAFNTDIDLYCPGFVIGNIDSKKKFKISYYCKNREGWGVDKKVLGITNNKGYIQGSLVVEDMFPLPGLPDQFIERKNINELLEKEYKTSRTINIHGSAGEGKTTLAIQFAKTLKAIVWWIDAKDETTFVSSLRKIIIFSGTSFNQGDDVYEVLTELFFSNNKTRYLIIFDNVITPPIVSLFPKVIINNENTSILVTSYLQIEGFRNISVANQNESYRGKNFLINLLEKITEKKADCYAKDIVSKYPVPLFIKMIGHRIFDLNCSYQYYLSKYLSPKGLPTNYSPSDYNKELRQVMYDVFKSLFAISKSAIVLFYIITQFSQAPFRREWLIDNFHLFSHITDQEEMDMDFGLIVNYSLIDRYNKNEYKQKQVIAEFFEEFVVEQNINIGSTTKRDCIILIEKLFNYDYFTYKSALENSIFELHAQHIAKKFQNMKTTELFDLQNKLGYYYWQMSDFERSLFFLENNKLIWESSVNVEESLAVFSCYSCIGRILLSQDKYSESIQYIEKARVILDILGKKNLISSDLKGISEILGSKAQNNPYKFFKSNILYSLSLLYLHTNQISLCLQAINESILINNELGINNVKLSSHCERIYVREFVCLVAVFKQSIEQDSGICILLNLLSNIEAKANSIINEFSTPALISKAILRLIGFAYLELHKKYPTESYYRFYDWSKIFDIKSTDSKFFEKLLQIQMNIRPNVFSEEICAE